MYTRNGKKLNMHHVLLRMTSILLVLTLVSCCMLSGMMARYAGVDTGTDQGRVAGFDVSATVTKPEGQPESLDMGTVGSSVYYVIQLQNQSEVAVAGDILIEMETALPEGVEVTAFVEADGTEGSAMGVEAENQQVFRVTPSVTIPADSTSEPYRICFTVGDVDYDAFVEEADGSSLIYQKDYRFDMHVKFAQID